MRPTRRRCCATCGGTRLLAEAPPSARPQPVDADFLHPPLPPAPRDQRLLRIAYIGPEHGTSLQRARALQRLGHSVTVIDPWAWLGKSRWAGRWLYHAGGIGAGAIIGRRLLAAVAASRPQMVWVNQGEFLGPGIVRKLRSFGAPVVSYANDNPFSGRDGLRFHSYQKALPYYDFVVVTFGENVEQTVASGAKRVARVWLTADEEAHTAAGTSVALLERYRSDVAFVGTWMPERGPLMVELLRQNLPLSIWGDGWQKAPEWPQLAPCWRGGGLYDQDYVAAIASAKICLGLLSKGNRNLHTSRSVEIPAMGGLLCAERTSEHLALYEDGREAVFWDNAAECATLCQRLLADEALRRDIARRGRERALRNNLFNEPLMAWIVEASFQRAGRAA